MIKSPTKPSTVFSRSAKIGCLRMWGGVYERKVPVASNSLLAVEEIVGPLADPLFSARMAPPNNVRAEGAVSQEVELVDLHLNPEEASVRDQTNTNKNGLRFAFSPFHLQPTAQSRP